MIKKLILFFLSLLILSFSSCSSKQQYQTTFLDMFDTVTTISGYFNSRVGFDKSVNKIKKRLLFYNKQFDIYNSYQGINNLKTINENAGIRPVEISDELFNFLVYCKEAYNISDRTVNICFGPVIQIWNKYREQGKNIPNINLLKKADKYTDIQNLILDKNKKTAFLKFKQCSLDVGAIGKGYACQIIKEYAKSVGFFSGIINVGGNVCVIGEKDSKNFSVGIENPDNQSDYLFKINVSDSNVVTSGDYQRFYYVNSKKYCHIIDPKTLFPASSNRAVTIVCKDGAVADVLSTALFIMDYNSGIKLVESTEDCEAFIIDKDGNYHFSNRFKKLIS